MAVSEPDAMVMGFVYPAGTFFITGFRQKVQRPKTPSRVTFHGRAILRHGPFFSRQAASEGGVALAFLWRGVCPLCLAVRDGNLGHAGRRPSQWSVRAERSCIDKI